MNKQKALSDAQEQAICEYRERSGSWKMTIRPQMVEKAANYLLSPDSLNRVVGPHWTRRFLDRHPKYFKRKQTPLAFERKIAPNLKDMEKYFESFANWLNWFRLAPDDMWNMDETGFGICCGKAKWVCYSRVVYFTDYTNGHHTTACPTNLFLVPAILGVEMKV